MSSRRSLFHKTFAVGKFAPSRAKRMVRFGKKAKRPSWQSGGSHWVTPKRGYIPRPRLSYARKFVSGRSRTGGYYGRYNANVGSELKFHDLDVTDAVIAAGGVVTPSINLIAEGTTESSRLGRKCTIKNIGWKYRLTLPSTATETAMVDTVRIIIYLDKQANGAAAATTDVLETASFQSFNNLSNSSRFVTLMDRVHTLNSTSQDAASAEVNENYTFYKKCNIPLEFSNTSGVIGEVRSNNIGILMVCSGGFIGIASKMRVRFVG